MKPHCCSVELGEKTVFLTHPLSPGEHSKSQRSAQEQNTSVYPKAENKQT